MGNSQSLVDELSAWLDAQAYTLRNNWHIHHGQVQVLICVAGRGWYQEWGKDAVEMTPGTVIAVPAEVKHWHGAAKDSWFQHLTYHKDVQEGASNEWLEKVADNEYGKF